MAYKRIFVSMKVATAIKFFALYPMRSLEAFNLSVGFLLETFQSFEFSLVVRERFKKLSDKRTQRSIPFGSLNSSFPINFIGK
jgi:hypothetical protein